MSRSCQNLSAICWRLIGSSTLCAALFLGNGQEVQAQGWPPQAFGSASPYGMPPQYQAPPPGYGGPSGYPPGMQMPPGMPPQMMQPGMGGPPQGMPGLYDPNMESAFPISSGLRQAPQSPVSQAYFQPGEARGGVNAYQAPGNEIIPTSFGDHGGPFQGNGHAVPNLGFRHGLGHHGNIQMSATPDYYNPTVGAGYNYHNHTNWLSSLTTNISANEEQFVYTVGIRSAFVRQEKWAMGGRLLGGGAVNHTISDDLADSSYHVSGDLYLGFQSPWHFMNGEHWVKFGWFYDRQEEFSKTGPALGLLLFNEWDHPITGDIALGFGDGDLYLNDRGEFYAVADEDFQFRFGTFVTENIQLGITTNYYTSPDERIFGKPDWEVGMFSNIYWRNMKFGMELTDDERDIVRGFFTFDWAFGGPRRKHHFRPADAQSWMLEPITRDISLRFFRGVEPDDEVAVSTDPVLGNITSILCIVRFPSQNPASTDPNNNGLVDPGEQFEFDLIFQNTTDSDSFNVSFGLTGTVFVEGPATITAATGSGVAVGTVESGTQIRTDEASDIDITINSDALPGEQIFVTFQAQADGEIGTFRCGPFIVGSIANDDEGTAERID
ncbi:Hypothetical protein PBC10988_8750 [Planctomycetales bacterium 10988]|nr:Hypothetical protein PBC10988_8750 [Planctomycetales bacterium 10988]